MATKDPRIDAYIDKASDFAKPILKHLRRVVHAGCPQVEETIKWQFPSFMYKGILCGMAAFKNHCTFGFWKGDLLFNGDAAAEKRRDDAMGQFGRITSLADLPTEKVLLSYIKEAIRLNDEGIKAPARSKPRVKQALVIPDFFTAALKKNPRSRQTFETFSYSHKKEYVEWLTEAKREATRQKRLETTLKWLAEGKARNWKYGNCGS
jgi:uncharacterized protein YdeI (YjbR/CyaY-like superfamily)